jgi:hypothetical protein
MVAERGALTPNGRGYCNSNSGPHPSLKFKRDQISLSLPLSLCHLELLVLIVNINAIKYKLQNLFPHLKNYNQIVFSIINQSPNTLAYE